jgi:hypothetical protein
MRRALVLYASEQAMVQAHQAVQALGGAGFLNDSVVSRLFRDAKLMEIGAGTSEIRRMLIGRELMARAARCRRASGWRTCSIRARPFLESARRRRMACMAATRRARG